MPKKALKINRAFIFDPCFGNMPGHWENYCKRLYHELVERGYTTKVFGQLTFDKTITDGVAYEPLFDCSPFEGNRNSLECHRQSKLFLENFRKIDDQEFQDNDLLIFHSIFPQTLLAIVEWTKELVLRKKVITTIFFQFPPAESRKYVSSAIKKLYYTLKSWLPASKQNNQLEWLDNNNVRFYQLNSRDLNQLVNKGSHILLASTDMLSRNFTTMFGCAVHYLPMPGPEIEEYAALTALAKNQPGASELTIKIGYFGHSSLAKGGQFLQYLVEKATARFPSIQFILHINPNPETEMYLNHFNNHSYPNVTCHFGHLEQDKLMDLMKQVDIVLMPYSPPKYALTPSAVFMEGMPLQKVFVLPKNTWAYQEARKYGAGYACFERQTHQGICNALLNAIRNYSVLKKRSISAGQRFYDENNISNYIDTLENVLVLGER